jgi:transposase-like protein
MARRRTTLITDQTTDGSVSPYVELIQWRHGYSGHACFGTNNHLPTLCRHRQHCAARSYERHTKGGNQRFRCRACAKTFCLHPGTTAHPDAFQQHVLAACHERASLRGICRVFGISRNTLADWLEKKSRAVAAAGRNRGSG